MPSGRTLSLSREHLHDLRDDELLAVAGGTTTGSDTCPTGGLPTFENSCLCTGPCDWSRLC
jgi:hypothetical protein